MKVHIALQVNRPGPELAARHHHPPAPGLIAGIYGGSKSFRTIKINVLAGPIISDHKVPVRKHRSFKQRTNTLRHLPGVPCGLLASSFTGSLNNAREGKK